MPTTELERSPEPHMFYGDGKKSTKLQGRSNCRYFELLSRVREPEN